MCLNNLASSNDFDASDVDNLPFPEPPCAQKFTSASATCTVPSTSLKSVQVHDILLRPYKEAEKRTRQAMRSKTIDLLADLVK